MAGDAAPVGRLFPHRSRTLRIALVAGLVVLLALAATFYYVFIVGKSSPNTAPHGLSILVSPPAGNITTAFRFTALLSDDQDPSRAIQVRWDWQNDGTWDTGWSTDKNASRLFTVPGAYTVKMEAEDTGGLTANVTASLTVSPANVAPRISAILISPSTGTNATTFTFTASVTDDHDPASAIQVRWDWQGDGLWDVDWSTTKVVQHQFSVPGNYTVALQATDASGLMSYATRVLTVSSPGNPPPPLRIGTIFSLTGSLSLYSAGQLNGVLMAVGEINANGGVLGQPIQLFSTDDQTNPSTAAQDAFTLINTDQVGAIIGATASGSCAAVVPVTAANSVVEVSPSCTSPIFSNLTFTGGWFARTVPSDALQAVVAATFAYGNLSQRRAAVIGINNAYGVATANAFAENFTRAGGQLTSPPLIVNEVSGGVTDYTPALVSILNTNPAPQVVYVAAYPADGVLMMKNWWNGIATYPAWANVNWTFSEGLYDQNNFINPLVSSGVNVSGFKGTAPAAYAGFLPPSYGPWAARYQTLFGSPPTLFAANAYDAAYLVALGAQAAGNASGSAIRSELRAVADPPGTVLGPGGWTLATQELAAGHDINYEGASGSVDIGARGDVPGSMIVWSTSTTNQLITIAFFNESFVVSLSPPNDFLPLPAPTGLVLAAAWSREPW